MRYFDSSSLRCAAKMADQEELSDEKFTELLRSIHVVRQRIIKQQQGEGKTESAALFVWENVASSWITGRGV